MFLPVPLGAGTMFFCVNQRLGISQNNVLFASFSIIFGSKFFKITGKTWEEEILTSVWSVQHPNAGQNMQECGVDKANQRLDNSNKNSKKV